MLQFQERGKRKQEEILKKKKSSNNILKFSSSKLKKYRFHQFYGGKRSLSSAFIGVEKTLYTAKLYFLHRETTGQW